MTTASRPGEHDVLLVLGLQNDFCAGGTLAVPGADELVPRINALINSFAHLVLIQDWHPPHHQCFASSHPGHRPFDSVQFSYGCQTLWPDHCVQGSHGAEFHPDLAIDRAELILRKGFRAGIDSCSAFYENDRYTPSGLAGYLRERGFQRVFIAGLAIEHCVLTSALDARREQFEVVVPLDACRPGNTHVSLAPALTAMRTAGVEIRQSL